MGRRLTTLALEMATPQPGLFSLVHCLFLSIIFKGKFVVNDKGDITTLQQIWKI